MLKRIAHCAAAMALGLCLVGLGAFLGIGVGKALAEPKALVKKGNHRAKQLPFCNNCRFITTLESDPGTYSASSKVLKATLTVGNSSQDWGIVPQQVPNEDGSKLTVLLIAKKIMLSDGKLLDNGTGTLVVQTTDDGSTVSTETNIDINVEPVNLDPCSTMSPSPLPKKSRP